MQRRRSPVPASVVSTERGPPGIEDLVSLVAMAVVRGLVRVCFNWSFNRGNHKNHKGEEIITGIHTARNTRNIRWGRCQMARPDPDYKTISRKDRQNEAGNDCMAAQISTISTIAKVAALSED